MSDHYPHLVRFDWSLNDRIRMSDQFGGPHGVPFTDVDRVADGVGVRSIRIRGAERLDQIGLTLTDGTVLAHGATGGSLTEMTLDQGERVVRITLTQGKHNGHTRIFSATVSTDRGRTLSAGRPTGDTVTYTAPAGWQITGFTGRSGAEVDKLSVIYQP